jgi:hypothetical protein
MQGKLLIRVAAELDLEVPHLKRRDGDSSGDGQQTFSTVVEAPLRLRDSSGGKAGRILDGPSL